MQSAVLGSKNASKNPTENDTGLITILTFNSVLFLMELTETARFPAFGFCCYKEQIWTEAIWAEPRRSGGSRPILPRRSLSGLLQLVGVIARGCLI